MVFLKQVLANVTFLLVANLALIRCYPELETNSPEIDEINLNETEKLYSISAFDKIDLISLVQSYKTINSNEIVLENVNFGCLGASGLTIKTGHVSSLQNLTMKIDHRDSTPIASFNLDNQLEKNTINTSVHVEAGVHDVYISLPIGSKMNQLKSIQFYTTKPNQEGSYVIISHRSARSLDVPRYKGGLETSPYQNQKTQKFTFKEMYDGYYQMRNNNGLALEVKDFGRTKINPVQSNDYRGHDNQLWSLHSSIDGYVIIRVRHSSQCMDVGAGVDSDNHDVITYDCHGGATQRWYLIPGC